MSTFQFESLKHVIIYFLFYGLHNSMCYEATVKGCSDFYSHMAKFCRRNPVIQIAVQYQWITFSTKTSAEICDRTVSNCIQVCVSAQSMFPASNVVLNTVAVKEKLDNSVACYSDHIHLCRTQQANVSFSPPAFEH